MLETENKSWNHRQVADFIKGLDLAERYFMEEGRPRLKAALPDLFERMAVGLAGDGSECYGYDDEISRDHDWGPGFCVWLTKADYAAMGSQIDALLSSLPKTFNGFGPRCVSIWGEGRIGAMAIDEFYRRFTGFADAPSDLADWLLIPENGLAACTNGRVFHDPLGEFSARRKRLLNFYPEDVRRKKIAARCMSIGQAGQYNFPRCLKRNEAVAAGYAQTKFIADLIDLVFLLNHRYRPFYKWMHRALNELPQEGAWFHGRIRELVDTQEAILKPDMIEALCQRAIGMLRQEGLSTSDSDYLPDHGPVIQAGIADAALRARNVWVG